MQENHRGSMRTKCNCNKFGLISIDSLIQVFRYLMSPTFYRYFMILAIASTIISCRSYPTLNDESWQSLDYSQLDHWAAHPDIVDLADQVPKEISPTKVEEVDVFFVHPTTYTKYKGELHWNADIRDEDLNRSTDESSIKFQASAFNSAGRVYAPRYRQAHIESYYDAEPAIAEQAFDRAYRDVRDAFEHYLKTENQGRPIIIASHSQGTTHTTRLLAEYFDGTDLQDQLVAAYLIGMPIAIDKYESLQPCAGQEDTGCIISWRTYKRGYVPDAITGDSILVTNPLTWTIEESTARKELNKGAILRNFNRLFPELVDAQVHDGMLWVEKPKFPWSFLFTRKNYHIADINFYYSNIRENVIARAESHLSMTK